MKRYLINTSAVVLLLAAIHPAASAQSHRDHSLHVSHKWKECSFQLDPSLTRSAWRRFTEEAGLVTYFRPLRDAQPMGAGKFELSALQWRTGIDDASSAWNDTFVHPDSTHWLFEGSGLAFPGVTLRAGVTNRVDVGAYFTKNPNANYGFYGGQVQYNLVREEKRHWAAATRVSFVSMYGPADLDFSVVGLDFLASKEFGVYSDWVSVSPYVGLSSYASRSHEKTAAVNLDDEYAFGSQKVVGAQVRIWRIDLGAEYSVARVNSRSLKAGVSF